MKKIYMTDKQHKQHVQEILRQMARDKWVPDYVVGITRGGLIAANMISQYLTVPMYSLDVSLRNRTELGPESNLWMAEDAFGYVDGKSKKKKRKKILIVDDINDTGATIDWIQADWRSGCLPDDRSWKDIFGGNVKTAFVVDNISSNFDGVNYYGYEINKAEEDVWVVFPWEDWWKHE